MNPLAIIFTLLTGYYLLKLPRTWAPLPLLIGASYMTLGQSISIGPFHFYVIRILITLGAIRVMFREEHLAGGWQNRTRGGFQRLISHRHGFGRQGRCRQRYFSGRGLAAA